MSQDQIDTNPKVNGSGDEKAANGAAGTVALSAIPRKLSMSLMSVDVGELLGYLDALK